MSTQSVSGEDRIALDAKFFEVLRTCHHVRKAVRKYCTANPPYAGFEFFWLGVVVGMEAHINLARAPARSRKRKK